MRGAPARPDRWSSPAAARRRTTAKGCGAPAPPRSAIEGSSDGTLDLPHHEAGQHGRGVDTAAVQEPAKSAERAHLEDVEAAVGVLDQIDAGEDEAEVARGTNGDRLRLRIEIRLLVAPTREDRRHPVVGGGDAPVG